jgi:hypothetical protein
VRPERQYFLNDHHHRRRRLQSGNLPDLCAGNASHVTKMYWEILEMDAAISVL